MESFNEAQWRVVANKVLKLKEPTAVQLPNLTQEILPLLQQIFDEPNIRCIDCTSLDKLPGLAAILKESRESLIVFDRFDELPASKDIDYIEALFYYMIKNEEYAACDSIRKERYIYTPDSLKVLFASHHENLLFKKGSFLAKRGLAIPPFIIR